MGARKYICRKQSLKYNIKQEMMFFQWDNNENHVEGLPREQSYCATWIKATTNPNWKK